MENKSQSVLKTSESLLMGKKTSGLGPWKRKEAKYDNHDLQGIVRAEEQ